MESSRGFGELADPWKLNDFFEALGPVLRLPPRAAESAPARPSLVGRTSGRRTLVLAGTALAIVAGAFGASPLMRALRPTTALPPELHGVWTTTAPRYRTRSFELSRTHLRLGLGGEAATYPISRLGRRDSASAAVYTIWYREGESTLEFAVAIGSDSVARIRNLPEVEWRRTQR